MTTTSTSDRSAVTPGTAADPPDAASHEPETLADAVTPVGPETATDIRSEPHETLAGMPRTAPHLDAEALVAWLIVGFRLFSRRETPSLADVRREAECAAMVIAMPRYGSISQAADRLRTSRRALRDKLKAAGLYPWTNEQAARYRIDLGPT